MLSDKYIKYPGPVVPLSWIHFFLPWHTRSISGSAEQSLETIGIKTWCRRKNIWDILFRTLMSLSVSPSKASSLGANRVKSPSCLSKSVRPAASIKDKKILQPWRSPIQMEMSILTISIALKCLFRSTVNDFDGRSSKHPFLKLYSTP